MTSNNPTCSPRGANSTPTGCVRRAVLALVCAAIGSTACAQAAYHANDRGLDYGIELVEADAGQLPKLQSFAAAVAPSGKWILVGGRAQGLHGFSSSTTAGNFADFNTHLIAVDPEARTVKGLALDRLPPSLADPLRVTNPQEYYDAATDTLYLVGGYGIDTSRTPPHKTTFGTLTAFNVTKMIAAVEAGNLSAAQGLIRQARDARLAVTGGGLERLGSRFMLVFGQFFDGEFVFDARELPYTQRYTEALRTFTIDERTLAIELFGEVQTSARDRPYHRRDLNVLADIDPANGEERIAVFGGVFRPGALLGYAEPVCIDRTNTLTVESGFLQQSNHYECAVIPVYSEGTGTISRTFIGGIKSEVLTPEQAARRNDGGPSDGLPWINTVARIAHRPDSDTPWVEYDMGYTPGKRYIGADAHFIPTAQARRDGVVDGRGIVQLDQVPPGARVQVGYLYGGIESDAPQGNTEPTNAFYEVFLNHAPVEGKPVR